MTLKMTITPGIQMVFWDKSVNEFDLPSDPVWLNMAAIFVKFT